MTSRRALIAATSVCAAVTLAHLCCIEQFGWFRDELYYIACSRHLAWGYVDHPPAVAAMAALATRMGHSLAAFRIVPVVLGIATMLLSGATARALGARSIGVLIAVTATALCPTLLFLFHTLSMNSLEPLLWTAFLFLLLRLAQKPTLSLHALLGVVIGVGLLNKHSMAFLVIAAMLGAVLAGRGRSLATRGFVLSAGIGFAIALPHLVWQARHGFPSLEFYRNASAEKMVRLSPLELVLGQVTLAGPGNLPVWLLGLVSLVTRKQEPGGRWLGLTYVVLLAAFIAMGAKAYYLLPIYPALFAAGGASVERWGSGRRVRFVPGVLAGLAFVLGVVTLPLAMPILSVERTIAWQERLGLAPPRAEQSKLGVLPQHFADMFGWPELVRAIARARETLPESERDRAQIVVFNYGEAGAVDWLGPKLGLPNAFSPHNSYWGWGTPKDDAPVIVVLSSERKGVELERVFERVTLTAEHDSPYAMPFERHLKIYVCSGWKRRASEVWAELRRFI